MAASASPHCWADGVGPRSSRSSPWPECSPGPAGLVPAPRHWGAACFLSYFFALFQHPHSPSSRTSAWSPWSSAGSALVLRFFCCPTTSPTDGCTACSMSCAAAAPPHSTAARSQSAMAHPIPLRTYLRRVDTIATAINDWQADVPTEHRCHRLHHSRFRQPGTRFPHGDRTRLPGHLEAAAGSKTAAPATAALSEPVDALATVLSLGADPTLVRRLGAMRPKSGWRRPSPIRRPTSPPSASIARDHRPRKAARNRPPRAADDRPAAGPATSASATASVATARPTPGPPPPSPPTPASTHTTSRWKPWVRAPTSRMTVQVVVATAIATGVGELISASRWYWAVTTAFLVFVGANTGRHPWASRRVAGTLAGVAVGDRSGGHAGRRQYCRPDRDLRRRGVLRAVFRPWSTPSKCSSSPSPWPPCTAFHRSPQRRHPGVVARRDGPQGAAVGIACAYLFSTSTHPTLLAQITRLAGTMDRVTCNWSATALTAGGSAHPDAGGGNRRRRLPAPVSAPGWDMIREPGGHRALNSQLERLMMVATPPPPTASGKPLSTWPRYQIRRRRRIRPTVRSRRRHHQRIVDDSPQRARRRRKVAARLGRRSPRSSRCHDHGTVAAGRRRSPLSQLNWA